MRTQVAIIGVYAASHSLKNFDPRCSTQPTKSALPILFGQLNAC